MNALARIPDACSSIPARQASGLALAVVPHPDAAVLELCAQLRERQAEWQRRWAAVSEDSGGDTPADKALDEYSERVWPGTGTALDVEDLAPQLIALRAVTADGRAAKAAAIVAMEDAYNYLDIEICGRDDDIGLMLSALRDCAGDARIPVGKDVE